MFEELKKLECICYGSDHPNCPYCKAKAKLFSAAPVSSASDLLKEHAHFYGNGDHDAVWDELDATE